MDYKFLHPKATLEWKRSTQDPIVRVSCDGFQDVYFSNCLNILGLHVMVYAFITLPKGSGDRFGPARNSNSSIYIYAKAVVCSTWIWLPARFCITGMDLAKVRPHGLLLWHVAKDASVYGWAFGSMFNYFVDTSVLFWIGVSHLTTKSLLEVVCRIYQ